MDTFELNGRITQSSFLDMVQFLGMSHRTGELRLQFDHSDIIAAVFVESGVITHVFYGKSTGKNALQKIIEEPRGIFTFLSDNKPKEHTVLQPVDVVLLELQKHVDEIRELRSRLPDDQSVLHLNPKQKQDISLNTGEWKVLSLINGKRSISRICELTGNEKTTKSVLLELISKKIISTEGSHEEWQELSPFRKTGSDSETEKAYPPLLRTNLVLKEVNGHISLVEIEKKLELPVHELLSDIKLLYETRWIGFPPEEEKKYLEMSHEW